MEEMQYFIAQVPYMSANLGL